MTDTVKTENRPYLPGDPKPGTGPTRCVTPRTSQDKLDEVQAEHGLDHPKQGDKL